MDTVKKLSLPCSDEELRSLKCGDELLLYGELYTARDAAHSKLCQLIEEGEALPFDLRGAAIYYTGPTPPREGEAIGSAGPTTSSRMDAYTPMLLLRGLRVMIGKGNRSVEVVREMVKNGAVYLGATGGAGALLSRRIVDARCCAFEELGTEAVYRLEVEVFPVTVVIDCRGENLYETGPKEYLAANKKPGEK